MKKWIFVAAVLWSLPAFAMTLNAGTPVCVSDDLLVQLLEASINNDTRAIKWLFDNGCAVSIKRMPVTVLGQSDDNMRMRVRVYNGSHAVEVSTLAADVE